MMANEKKKGIIIASIGLANVLSFICYWSRFISMRPSLYTIDLFEQHLIDIIWTQFLEMNFVLFFIFFYLMSVFILFFSGYLITRKVMALVRDISFILKRLFLCFANRNRNDIFETILRAMYMYFEFISTSLVRWRYFI